MTVVDRPWGEGADEGALEELLRKDTGKKIKAVCVVHNETTTGVTSDIAGCRKVRHRERELVCTCSWSRRAGARQRAGVTNMKGARGKQC